MQVRIHEPQADEYLAVFNALDHEQQQEHLTAGHKQMLAEFVAMARSGYGPGADADARSYFAYEFVYRVYIGRYYAEVGLDLRHPVEAKMRHLGLALQAVSEKIEMEAFMDEFRREFPL